MTNKISFEEFISACEMQQKLAELFDIYNNNLFKYSKKYIYYFDSDSALWVEKDKNFIIDRMSSFMFNQQTYFLTNSICKSQDDLLKLVSIIKKQTTFKYLSDVANFFLSRINDETFIDKLDRAYPYLLPIKNKKVIDLRNGDIRFRLEDDFYTYFCDVEPSENKTEIMQNFINSLMCDNKKNIKYLQKILGYCITGETDAQCFFIWWGKGSNGKSLLLNLLNKIMGKSYKPASKEIFIKSSKSSGVETLSIKDARLITYSETASKDSLNDDLIKRITGEDQITARGLYKDPITFSLICKLILCTNHKPELNAQDQGMRRRVKYLPFNAKFTDKPTKENEYLKDVNLLKTLIQEDYINEFFSWIVKGSIVYYKDKSFNPPPEIMKEENKYLDSKASIDAWFRDSIIKDDTKKILRSELYNNYKEYCEDNDVLLMKKSDLFESMNDNMGHTKKLNGGLIYYIGYDFKPNQEEEQIKKYNLDL